MSFMEKIKSLLGKTSHDKIPPTVDKNLLKEKIRQSTLFNGLDNSQLEQVFNRMESVAVKNGEIIIKEGEEGDYYYLLVTGTAKVTRSAETGEQILLAELTEPKGFGEEALISNAKRNATITMTSDGIIMRLSKDAFNDYIKEPMITWLSPADSQKQIAKNAKWIDVRDEEESKTNHLHGAILIPLKKIREKAGELDKSAAYICYCENGRQSSTAAFLLKQMGFNNVGVLRGGLQGLRRAGLT